MKEYTEKIEGMHCATCAINIQDKVSSLDGVKEASVNYATKKISVKYDNEKVGTDDFKREIKELGYLISSKENIQNEYLKKEKTKLFFILPVAFFLFAMMIWELVGMRLFPNSTFEMHIPYIDEILFVISTITLLTVGKPFLNGLIRFFKGKGANMNTLIGLGTITAYIYSVAALTLRYLQVGTILDDVIYFEVIILIIGFVVWGKYLEEKSKAGTGNAIKELLELQSKTAILYENGKERKINIDEIKKNDILIVKPGSKIPIDAEVIEGDALIDQSVLTGESIPVKKNLGDNVFQGTINKQGYLKIKVKKVGGDTMLSTIIKLVEQAQNSKAPIEKLVDKISRVFVPTVMVLAFISLLVWIISGNISGGVSVFVATLVIACPCALGLATPTAIIVGVGKGAKKGILIKDVEQLQKLNKVNIIVFDKTGTLTHGKPKVTKIETKISEKEVLEITSSLESKSQHPLAFAINEKAQKLNIISKRVKEFKNIDGKGVAGIINDKEYYLGSPQYMQALGLELDNNSFDSTVMILAQRETKIQKKGKSVNKKSGTEIILLAKIYIEDTIKEDAKDTINKLHLLGIKTVLLSGDNKNIVEKIAKELNIKESYYEVLPDKKASIIKDLKKEGIIAMVGDGINDAPALALADVGIAMATGTDIAIESSDITLLGGNIEKVPMSIELSKDIMNTIKQNLFWAFVYNILAIPLAMGVFYPAFGLLLNPAFAGIAMSFSSVSVVLNSLRLKFKKL